MTQEDLNQFLAVLMYGLAHNSAHYHECCYGTKQTKEQTYQVARIPVFKVDGFDTLLLSLRSIDGVEKAI